MPNIEFTANAENPTNIKVIGVGGGGCNAVDRMISAGMRNVSFAAANTDLQALSYNSAPEKIQLGIQTTKGLGAGMDPEKGEKSAEEQTETLQKSLEKCDMLFITAGMGGGTGTGAAPVIARIAKEMECLTVAVVTKPFSFEGSKKMDLAEKAIDKLVDNVDALITIPNENLLQIVDKRLPMADCLKIADSVLMEGVRGIADLITNHGMFNVDFADVRRIMADKGNAVMGMATVKGEQNAQEIVEKLISNPLIEGGTIEGASGMLINVTHGSEASLHELKAIVDVLSAKADNNADIINGFVEEPGQEDEVRITVIATGYRAAKPITRSKMFESAAVETESSTDPYQSEYIEIDRKNSAQPVAADDYYEEENEEEKEVMDEPYSGEEALKAA
ncbi:MAG TPA: cell division protein FtsZ, partial [Spirochaetota bacterium]|nr:cell division protein FtsZ [Spirochaetota bacterium]